MSAATTKPKIFGNIAMKLAAVDVNHGEIACVNTAGYLRAGTVAVSLVALGLFARSYSNSGGAAGDIDAVVMTGYDSNGGIVCYPLTNYAGDLCDQTSVGRSVYVAGANAVAKTNGSETRSRAGRCWGFTPSGDVLVHFDGDIDADALDALTAANVSLADAGGLYAAAELEAAFLELKVKAPVRQVRGVVMNNVASLSSFTVTGNAYDDGLTYEAGDRVLLVGQSTAAQNGVYVVGTVTSTTAPLTRATDMPAGAAYVNGSVVEVSEGTIWRGSSWKVMGTGALVVGTDNPAYYPRVWMKTVTLSSGTYATATATDGVFLYSTTTSSVQATRNTAGGTLTNTTHYFCPVAGRTAGIAGTGQVTVTASVAAGTVNTADTSTVDLQITNW